MGQFSVEKPVAPGSALSGNQQIKVSWSVDQGLPVIEKLIHLTVLYPAFEGQWLACFRPAEMPGEP